MIHPRKVESPTVNQKPSIRPMVVKPLMTVRRHQKNQLKAASQRLAANRALMASLLRTGRLQTLRCRSRKSSTLTAARGLSCIKSITMMMPPVFPMRGNTLEITIQMARSLESFPRSFPRNFLKNFLRSITISTLRNSHKSFQRSSHAYSVSFLALIMIRAKMVAKTDTMTATLSKSDGLIVCGD